MATRYRAPAIKATERRVPGFHAHRCQKCGRKYKDNCKTPLVDDICIQPCTNGMPPPIWDLSLFPHDCCKQPKGCRLIKDNDTLAKHALGGPGPWYICTTCGRTHPLDPSGRIADQ